MEPVIRIEQLEKRFGQVTALEDLSLDVAPGDTHFLLGPNGSGKTTLLRLLAGGLRPTDGSLQVLGEDPYRAPDRIAARTGIAFEDHYLPTWAAASAFLRFSASVRGASAASVEGAADTFDLKSYWNRPMEGYSAGMRKRVALAQAWLGDPPLLILDEPFSNLDPEGRRLVARLLQERSREGRTTLVASHLAEAGTTPSHLEVLVNGRLEAHGPLEELADRYVARGLDLSAADPAGAVRALLARGVRPVTADEGRVHIEGDAETIERALTTLKEASVAAEVEGETFDLWAIYTAVLFGRRGDASPSNLAPNP